MTIALDLGASALRMLRVEKDRLAARCTRAVYAAVEDTPARRRMLDQIGKTYAVCDGSLAVPGDAAADVAELVQTPVLPLLPGGELMDRDPPARQMLATLIETMTDEPTVPHELCGMTLPGVAGGAQGRETETARFLTHLLRLKGFEPRLITPGAALVLAELVSDGFTGIGMTFGAAACHVSLVHRSMEIASCAVARGGMWIDEQLAQATEQFLWDAQGNRYLNAEMMCRWKESPAAQIGEPRPGERDQALVRLYTELVTDVVQTAGRTFREVLMLPEAWPTMSVVACGGPTRIAGFVPLLAQVIRQANWPLRVKQVRLAEDADFTVARGCLIHAELEAEVPPSGGAAIAA